MHIRWKSLLLAALSLFGGGPFLPAAEDPFCRLTNALGYADREGYFSIWWDVPKQLQTAKSGTLPLRLHFSSNPVRPVESCLGLGWWVPLLESCLIQEDEAKIRFLTPGGGTESLKRRDGASSYVSKDSKWKAEDTGEGRATVTGVSGWRFEFKDGLLVAAETPQKEELQWRRSEGRVVQIISKNPSKVLLEAKYDPRGLLTDIRSNGGDGFVTFAYQDMPVFKTVQGLPVVARVLPSLKSLKDCCHEVGTWEFIPDLNTGEISLHLTSKGAPTVAVPDAVKKTFGWKLDSARLSFDPQSKYGFEPATDNNADRRPIIFRSYPDGTREGYHYYPKTGVMWNLQRDGTTIESQFIRTPGEAFGKIRKSIRLQPGSKNPLGVEEAQYSMDGKPLRLKTAVSQCNLIMQFGGDGVIRSITSEDDTRIKQLSGNYWLYDRYGFAIAVLDNKGKVLASSTSTPGHLQIEQPNDALLAEVKAGSSTLITSPIEALAEGARAMSLTPSEIKNVINPKP